LPKCLLCFLFVLTLFSRWNFVFCDLEMSKYNIKKLWKYLTDNKRRKCTHSTSSITKSSTPSSQKRKLSRDTFTWWLLGKYWIQANWSQFLICSSQYCFSKFLCLMHEAMWCNICGFDSSFITSKTKIWVFEGNMRCIGVGQEGTWFSYYNTKLHNALEDVCGKSMLHAA
jgi:hypothetical protein